MRVRGFTLIEILLVVAMITIVAGTGFLVLGDIVATDVRNTAAQLVTQSMRRAQLSSRNMREDDMWGVYVSSSSATVFRGDTYTTRDAAYDEAFPFPRSVTVSGTTEFVFGKGTGLVPAPATVSMTFNDETLSVSINAIGAIHHAD